MDAHRARKAPPTRGAPEAGELGPWPPQRRHHVLAAGILATTALSLFAAVVGSFLSGQAHLAKAVGLVLPLAGSLGQFMLVGHRDALPRSLRRHSLQGTAVFVALCFVAASYFLTPSVQRTLGCVTEPECPSLRSAPDVQELLEFAPLGYSALQFSTISLGYLFDLATPWSALRFHFLASGLAFAAASKSAWCSPLAPAGAVSCASSDAWAVGYEAIGASWVLVALAFTPSHRRCLARWVLSRPDLAASLDLRRSAWASGADDGERSTSDAACATLLTALLAHLLYDPLLRGIDGAALPVFGLSAAV